MSGKTKRVLVHTANICQITKTHHNQSPEVVPFIFFLSVWLTATYFVAKMSSMSPVMQAASNGETFRLKSLIEKGEKVNDGDKKGFTPLHAAVNGNSNIIPLRLTRGKGVLQTVLKCWCSWGRQMWMQRIRMAQVENQSLFIPTDSTELLFILHARWTTWRWWNSCSPMEPPRMWKIRLVELSSIFETFIGSGSPIHCCATGDGNVGFDAVSTASGGYGGTPYLMCVWNAQWECCCCNAGACSSWCQHWCKESKQQNSPAYCLQGWEGSTGQSSDSCRCQQEPEGWTWHGKHLHSLSLSLS